MSTDNDPPSSKDRLPSASSNNASNKPIRRSNLLAEMAARLDDKLRAAGYEVKDALPSKGFVATFPPSRKPTKED